MKVKLEIVVVVVVVFFSHMGGHFWYKTNVVIKAKKDQEEWKFKKIVKSCWVNSSLVCSRYTVLTIL